MPIMDFQQRSVIRYSVLRTRPNKAIHTKLSPGYCKDALGQHTVDTWGARFRNGRTSVEDDDRPGRPFRDDFSAALSGYLETNPHASCREIVKGLFVPMSIISRVLEKMGS
jgi:hypothetical protein